MGRYLMVDIGAGTMDVLFYDDETEEHFKAVVESPVRTLAKETARLPGDLVLTGSEMGGGPLSTVLKERAERHRVVMSVSSAATIHHNLQKVRALGIEILPDQDAAELMRSGKYSTLSLGDVQPGRLKTIVEGFGVPFEFDVVGICAQDHGVPPPGRSHLDYRHDLFKARLDDNPFPHTLLYGEQEIPVTFNRLGCMAKDARSLPVDEIYVMDSGMAAILGAALDSRAKGVHDLLVLDIATSHTVGAAWSGQEIGGFFEYHTSDITLPRLEVLMRDLADGKLQHERILAEGGHGAYLRKVLGWDRVELIVATGPKRRLISDTKLPVVYGAPLGDNMMTGTAGLLEAIRRRKGLSSLPVL